MPYLLNFLLGGAEGGAISLDDPCDFQGVGGGGGP